MEFDCIISDPEFSVHIIIDGDYKTIDDLKRKIAHQLYIKSNQFSITNLFDESKSKSFPNKCKFNLKIIKRYKDINFFLSNNKHFIIPNCYKMKINEIIDHFKKYNIYFSERCIKKIRFRISNINIPNFEYSFYAIFTENPNDEVYLYGKYVILDYDQKKFILYDQQNPFDARNLILKILNETDYDTKVHIQIKETKSELTTFDVLYENEKYFVYTEYKFYFAHISTKEHKSEQVMDFCAKVSDAKKRLFQILCDEYSKDMVNVIIYKENGREIANENDFLKDIKNIEKTIFFDIQKNPQKNADLDSENDENTINNSVKSIEDKSSRKKSKTPVISSKQKKVKKEEESKNDSDFDVYEEYKKTESKKVVSKPDKNSTRRLKTKSSSRKNKSNRKKNSKNLNRNNNEEEKFDDSQDENVENFNIENYDKKPILHSNNQKSKTKQNEKIIEPKDNNIKIQNEEAKNEVEFIDHSNEKEKKKGNKKRNKNNFKPNKKQMTQEKSDLEYDEKEKIAKQEEEQNKNSELNEESDVNKKKENKKKSKSSLKPNKKKLNETLNEKVQEEEKKDESKNSDSEDDSHTRKLKTKPEEENKNSELNEDSDVKKKTENKSKLRSNFKPKIKKSDESESQNKSDSSHKSESEKQEENTEIQDSEATDDSQIKIHFIFEENSEDENSSFDEFFDPKTTVSEIESRLKTKFDAEDKITIEYEDKEEGEKSSFGRKMTIENIIEDIKTSTSEGKTINILYINKSKSLKSTKLKKSFKPKVTKALDSSSDSDSSNKPANKETKFSHKNDHLTKNTKQTIKKQSVDKTSKQNKKEKSKNESDSFSSSLNNDDGDDDNDNDNEQTKKFNKNDKKENKNKNSKHNYFYRTNKEDKIQEIELPKGADVRELKKVIAKENKVDDLSNIKVIFAGKDLIDKLILDELEIGDTILYVYIRSLEDILLMTAKALKIEKNIDDDDDDDDSY